MLKLLIQSSSLVLIAFSCIYAYSLLVPLLLNNQSIKFFPLNNLDDVKQLLRSLQQSSADDRHVGLFVAYCVGYLIKQTFAIPGSGLLNLLAGALFGHLNAWFLVNTLTAVGSTLSYMLSWLFLSEIIERISFLKRQVSKFKSQVETARKNNDLLTYMLFIRMFPFTPNWLVNIASPHVDVPVWPFFISMLIGTSPYSFITTGSGKMLNEIESLNDIFQPKHLVTIALMALVIMILPILKKRVQSSVDAKSD
ncbi:hypothetical protein MIR68_007090 [Amoeboaphelidium protococcarum]|nr:hypothetical protein MIR68_007090 [Amoeboaphelidium protococcarum]